MSKILSFVKRKKKRRKKNELKKFPKSSIWKLKNILEENVWPQIYDVNRINLYAAKIENRTSVLKKFGETHFH